MRPLLYVVRGEVNVITETGPLAMAGIIYAIPVTSRYYLPLYGRE